VIGNLATLQPIFSPMLWNSITTGKRADKHGILGLVEPDPHSGWVRPVSSTPRKVKAVIEQFVALGYIEAPTENQSRAVALAPAQMATVLEAPLDRDAMLAQIDPKLHRQRDERANT
jgi:hypothetical protein